MPLSLVPVLVAIMFAVDRWTKVLVDRRMELGESIPVIPGFFSLTYVHNRGAAFGLGADLPEQWRVLFFVALTLVVTGVLGWMLMATPRAQWAQRLALTGIIGGALGNLYDRIFYGRVIDFLDVYVGSWHWPAFNAADSFISVGAVVLVLASFAGGREEDQAR